MNKRDVRGNIWGECPIPVDTASTVDEVERFSCLQLWAIEPRPLASWTDTSHEPLVSRRSTVWQLIDAIIAPRPPTIAFVHALNHSRICSSLLSRLAAVRLTRTDEARGIRAGVGAESGKGHHCMGLGYWPQNTVELLVHCARLSISSSENYTAFVLLCKF